MPYEVVENFAAGLDNRKSPIVAPGGTLTRLTNAVVNPGGEIEKRRAFVKVADVPNSFGFATTGSNLYVFGRNIVPPAATLTADGTALAAQGVNILETLIPNSAAGLMQSDFDTFDGKIYLACRRTGDLTGLTTEQINPHYYNSIETEGSGKGFYVRTYQSKMYAVLNKLLYFSSVGNPMVWDAESIIDAVTVVKVDNTNPVRLYVSTGEITQFVQGRACYVQGVTVPGLTAANNFHYIGPVNNSLGYFYLDGVNGSTATTDQTTGVKATPAIAILNISNTNPAACTVSAADIVKFTDGMKVRINGLVGGIVPPPSVSYPNANVFTISSVNSPANTFKINLNAAAFAAPQTTDVWSVQTTDVIRTGRGYINLSLQDADAETLSALEVYYDKLAVFTTESTQIWAVDPDPLQNAFTQLLRDSGTTAPRSALQYGSGDVLYLDPSGVRSLKAKDSSNSAAVSDIGSPVDTIVRKLLLAKGQAYMNKAISLLEPSIGRFWMVFPDHIMALSYFPGPKITAWSEFTLPFLGTALIEHALTCAGKVYIRDDQFRIWVYGGASGTVYNQMDVEVRLPYLSGKKPGHNKLFEALDITAAGDWEVRVSYDFNHPDDDELVGNFSFPAEGGGTWASYRSELTGYSSHISLRFKNDSTAFAALSNVAIHYQLQDDEQ